MDVTFVVDERDCSAVYIDTLLEPGYKATFDDVIHLANKEGPLSIRRLDVCRSGSISWPASLRECTKNYIVTKDSLGHEELLRGKIFGCIPHGKSHKEFSNG